MINPCDSDLTPCCNAYIIYISNGLFKDEEEIKSCENCGLPVEEEEENEQNT
tara:strand:+ start:631 stop:786 length:156 start_codon:yes stop_codon:yes gene_type:complete